MSKDVKVTVSQPGDLADRVQTAQMARCCRGGGGRCMCAHQRAIEHGRASGIGWGPHATWQREARPAWAEVLSDFGEVVGGHQRGKMSVRGPCGVEKVVV